ncbi:hypothetical protein D8S78_08570 [Natrialba swarupiae]|nr:hypothetical protein [Natrialba swarupiae]
MASVEAKFPRRSLQTTSRYRTVDRVGIVLLLLNVRSSDVPVESPTGIKSTTHSVRRVRRLGTNNVRLLIGLPNRSATVRSERECYR